MEADDINGKSERW